MTQTASPASSNRRQRGSAVAIKDDTSARETTSSARDAADASARASIKGSAGQGAAMLRLMRPHQWIKNLFVAAPLFFTPPIVSFDILLRVLVGMAVFCLVTSAVYILNDYMDRETDRLHPTKARRPLAAGTVGPSAAFALMAALLVTGFATALWLSPELAGLLAIYFAANLAYSLRLKHMAILDVLIIAFGFVLRIAAGAVLINVEPSAWIMIVTGLLALFLALGKRRDDLEKSLGNDHRRSLEGYNMDFLDIAVAVILGALLVAYMVYTTDREVMAELGTERIYYTSPFVIAGILRYLQIMLVERRSGSPTVIVLTDKFLIATIVLWAITFAYLIHG